MLDGVIRYDYRAPARPDCKVGVPTAPGDPCWPDVPVDLGVNSPTRGVPAHLDDILKAPDGKYYYCGDPSNNLGGRFDLGCIQPSMFWQYFGKALGFGWLWPARRVLGYDKPGVPNGVVYGRWFNRANRGFSPPELAAALSAERLRQMKLDQELESVKGSLADLAGGTGRVGVASGSAPPAVQSAEGPPKVAVSATVFNLVRVAGWVALALTVGVIALIGRKVWR
jgi:hypothetical protein